MTRWLPYVWLLLFLAWLWFSLSMLSAQVPESAIGEYPLPAVVGMSGDPFAASVKVIEIPTGRTLGELPTFHLAIGGARVTVIGDSNVPLIRWLRAHDKTTVHLTLTPTRLAR